RLAPPIEPVVVPEGDGSRRGDMDVHAVPVSDLVRLLPGLEVLEGCVGKHGGLQRIPSPISERLPTPVFRDISGSYAPRNTVIRCFLDDGIGGTHRRQAGA